MEWQKLLLHFRVRSIAFAKDVEAVPDGLNLPNRKPPVLIPVSCSDLSHSLSLSRTQAPLMLTDEMRYKLMRVLEANPEMSQRALAKELGVSLGKVNFCLQALIQKGLVKAKNFSNSQNKVAYMYLLTPRGIEQKSNLTLQFLRIKTKEFENLRNEIAQIRRELNATQ